jgi:hypothetical protein
MTGAGDEFYPQSFQIVIGIVDRVYFQLATVARTGIDQPDIERATEHFQYLLLQTLLTRAHSLIRLWSGFRFNPGLDDLF